MKFEHLLLFSKLANYKSLNQASEELYISHQALSKILTSLETYFETTLVERYSNGIRFTEHGLYLAKKVDKIASILEQSQLQLKTSYLKNQTNKITLHTDLITNTQILPKVLPVFNKHYPFIEFDFIVHETFSNVARIDSFSEVDIPPGTIAIFSFIATEQPTLNFEKNTNYTLLDKNELLIAAKLDTLAGPITNFVLNEKEFCHNSALLNYLPTPKIFYVKSQRQCYLGAQGKNAATITFGPNHYTDAFDLAITPFSIPLYLYTYIIDTTSNHYFSKVLQATLEQASQKNK